MDHQPRIIQLYFDGVEVLRIEDGKKSYEVLVPSGIEPELIEMRWDGEVVYAISPPSSQVLLNRLHPKASI